MFQTVHDRLDSILYMAWNIFRIILNPINNIWQIKRAIFIVSMFLILLSTTFSAIAALLHTLSAAISIPATLSNLMLFVPENTVFCFSTLFSIRILLVLMNLKLTIFSILLHGYPTTASPKPAGAPPFYQDTSGTWNMPQDRSLLENHVRENATRQNDDIIDIDP